MRLLSGSVIQLIVASTLSGDNSFLDHVALLTGVIPNILHLFAKYNLKIISTKLFNLTTWAQSYMKFFSM